jgi:hypothetical protein
MGGRPDAAPSPGAGTGVKASGSADGIFGVYRSIIVNTPPAAVVFRTKHGGFATRVSRPDYLPA